MSSSMSKFELVSLILGSGYACILAVYMIIKKFEYFYGDKNCNIAVKMKRKNTKLTILVIFSRFFFINFLLRTLTYEKQLVAEPICYKLEK